MQKKFIRDSLYVAAENVSSVKKQGPIGCASVVIIMLLLFMLGVTGEFNFILDFFHELRGTGPDLAVSETIEQSDAPTKESHNEDTDRRFRWLATGLMVTTCIVIGVIVAVVISD